MKKAELTIQLIKIIIALALGVYFLFWSIEVLKALKLCH